MTYSKNTVLNIADYGGMEAEVVFEKSKVLILRNGTAFKEMPYEEYAELERNTRSKKSLVEQHCIH
jgi:hypothetical protein